MFTPEFQHGLFPTYHSSENENDRNRRQTDEKEKWIGLLHHAQAFLMTQNLETNDARRVRERTTERLYLHDGHSTVGHCCPIDGANENATGEKRTKTIENTLD